MNTLNFETKLSGEYNLVITRANGELEETGWFDNLILDSGLNRIGGSATATDLTVNAANYARVGTGSSTPVATQTALDAQIATSSKTYADSTTTNEGAPNYATLHTYQYAFAQGAVVGNITEVGVGWDTTGNTLFSRALILNSSGVPTSITLVALDQLTVYYRLKVIPNLADSLGTVNISGTNYPYTARICNCATFATYNYFLNPNSQTTQYSILEPRYIEAMPAGCALSSITGTPSTVGYSAGGTPVRGTYSAGTFYRDDVFPFSISQGNVTGGIQVIRIAYNYNNGISYQYRFDTPIPKTNTATLSLTIRMSWARA